MGGGGGLGGCGGGGSDIPLGFAALGSAWRMQRMAGAGAAPVDEERGPHLAPGPQLQGLVSVDRQRAHDAVLPRGGGGRGALRCSLGAPRQARSQTGSVGELQGVCKGPGGFLGRRCADSALGRRALRRTG